MASEKREWFVLKISAGRETAVTRYLRSLGIHVFLPLARTDFRQRDGSLTCRVGPLFPRYVFILIRWADRRLAMFVRGVKGFLGYKEGMEKAPTVRKEEIDFLKSRIVTVNGWEAINLSSRPTVTFQPNQEVKIVEGPYAGFVSKILSIVDKKARVAITFAGILMPVWIPTFRLAPV